MEHVSVSMVLAARDERADRQQTWLQKYKRPLISFTMNIPGSEKSNALIQRAFQIGLMRVENTLFAHCIPVLERMQKHAVTGPEALWAVNADAGELKKYMCTLEEADPLGRLLDLDVIDGNGVHLSRGRERNCILCGGPVRICGRSRAHSAEDLFARVTQILTRALSYPACVAQLARRALIMEAEVTPKPGLVDKRNSGAHRDMTLADFYKSADLLEPYFADAARLGMEHAGADALQRRGRQAEEAMLSAVGVNTHKGAVFSLGILCYAGGKLGRGAAAEAVLLEGAALGTHYLHQLKAHNPMQTGGEKQYAIMRLPGARGEAAAGFPSVSRMALPVYQNALRAGKSHNDAALCALMHLMARVPDSNVLRRGGEEGLAYMRARAEKLIADGITHQALIDFDQDMIARNLSAGGCADLLAVTLFLHLLCEENSGEA
ncbi:MAG: citrate lyase holo-[acyl-carrier protein] synthase [Clostridiales bacterium]|nr:citrate lyase holo-[acyl-carrier protein] synthase [Clostridiales bacterium]